MSSLRVAGPEGIQPEMSCGNGVEDELAPEQEAVTKSSRS